MPFNEITDSGLTTLLTRASELVLLDLEGDAIEFDPISQGVNLLWREGGPLCHLNVLYNNFTIRSFIKSFCRAGRSQLETLDVAASTRYWVWAPACLLFFVLANCLLECLDIMGTQFFVGEDDKLALGSFLGRVISVHPLLRAMSLKLSHFIARRGDSIARSHISMWQQV